MAINKLVVLQPTQQQLADYANALITINNYAWAITNQNLPVLSYPPANYGDFTTEFAAAKTHALNWSTNIFVDLIQFPTTIVQQAAALFNMEDTIINAYLDALIANPNDANAKAGLGKALDTLLQLIKAQVANATLVQQQLGQFSTDIKADAQTLTQIANNAAADAGDDQDTISQLTADIASLKKEIATANTLLTVSEIGMGVSLWVGLVGIACCLIPGAQAIGVGLIIVGVAGEAASIAGTVIESLRIKSMQHSIDSDQKQITGLNQDVILLKGVSQSFNDLYEANLQAQNALTSIINMWNGLATTVTQVQTDLTNVESDNTAAQYTQARSDFQDAEQAWSQVVQFATALSKINYSWQDASGTWHNYAESNPSGTNSGTVSDIPSEIPASQAA